MSPSCDIPSCETTSRFATDPSPAAQTMTQVQQGTVAEVIGTDFIAAVSPPTALSLTCGLDQCAELISAAARVAEAD